MMLQPIVPLFILIPIVLAIIGFCIWRIIKEKHTQSTIPWMRRLAMGILVAIMASGPSIPGGTAPSGMLNLDVIFVVDTTYSVIAEDYNGSQTRLTGIKQDIMNLSEKMIGARYSIITFDREAELLLPMTTDRGSLETSVSSLMVTGFATSKGSSIDKPIEVLRKQIDTNKKQNPQRPNLVFYLGDGEQTTKEAPKSFDSIKTLIKGGAVLGYGTQTGGKMKDSIYEPETAGYVEDYYSDNAGVSGGQPALSKANPDNLKAVAAQMGVSYVDRNNGGDIAGTFGESNAERVADTTKPVAYYTNLYYLFAVPFALLFIWELLYLLRRFSELKAAKPEQHHE